MRLLFILGLIFSPSLIFSQEKLTFRDSLNRAELVVPRLSRQSVKSLIPSAGESIDTLATELDYVKVVLYADNTWKYIKDEKAMIQKDVFTENWNNTQLNPYNIELSKLPITNAIWIVDSLSSYSCPYIGKLHPHGKFGIRRGRMHHGVDLPLKTGTPIYSPFDGIVRLSSYVNGYGNVVVIRHENGIETYYAHLSKRSVSVNDVIKSGDVLGLGGSTGRSTGPHLHFETRYLGHSFDPQWLINFETGELRHRLFVLKKKYFSPYSNYEQNFEDEIYNHEQDLKEAAELAAMRWHTVRSGDNLGRIAINNNTTVTAICRLNGISSRTVLKIGRKLRVR